MWVTSLPTQPDSLRFTAKTPKPSRTFHTFVMEQLSPRALYVGCEPTGTDTWHRRLEHLNFRSMDILRKNSNTRVWTTRTTHPRAGYVR